MGIEGSLNPAFIFTVDYNKSNLTNGFETCFNCLYHGTEWLYTFSETFFFYDFKVIYYNFFNLFFDDAYDLFFLTGWWLNLQNSWFTLFWAVILDTYFINQFFNLFYNNDWYRNILISKETSLLFIYHPEMLFVNLEYLNYLYNNNLSTIFISIIENNIAESFLTPIMNFFQILGLIYFISIFINFYFSYYNSSTKEESLIDSDYLTSSLLTESEKEIGAMDDMLLALMVLVYIFGWYVYVYVWTLLSTFPEIAMVFYLFPFLYYIIISMPTYLIYDFGLYFLVYLRGVGTSSLLLMELMYDYIACIAFYVRLLVQGVRLVLMIFTYISLHDLILFFDFNTNYFIGFENIWESSANYNGTLNTLSYYLLFIIPTKIIYWLYELFHTFFVITAQFVAFFAMVFWLFLFLYTMFVLEKHENYFSEKRKVRKNYLNKFLKLKLN